MKKATSLLLALVMCLSIVACSGNATEANMNSNTNTTAGTQESEQTDLVTVSLCSSEEFTVVYGDSNSHNKLEYTYDSHGRIVSFASVTTQGNDIFTSTYKYTYNENGDLSSISIYAPDNTIVQETLFTYSNGRVSTKYVKNISYETNRLYNFFYDSDGMIIATESSDSDGNYSTINYVYDESGFPESCQIFDSEGTISQFAFMFDHNGKLVTFTSVEDSSMVNVIYTFDGDRLISSRILEDADEKDRIEYSYNTDDRTVTSTSFIGDVAEYKAVAYYDQNNNLVRSKTEWLYTNDYITQTDYTYITIQLPANEANAIICNSINQLLINTVDTLIISHNH